MQTPENGFKFDSDYYHTIHKPKNKLLIVHAYKPVVNSGPWEDRAERVLGNMTHQEEKAKILREKYSRIVSGYNDLNVYQLIIAIHKSCI